jgi:hypothetical protein
MKEPTIPKCTRYAWYPCSAEQQACGINDYSQAGQTRFVFETLIKPDVVRVGSFLDIGCAGLSISNTLGLEELGWRGWLIDNSSEAQLDSINRPSKFILGDATQLNYGFLPAIVDYLSLDIDGATLDALRKLPLDKTRFRVITIEHDQYSRGDTLRIPIYETLIAHGYTIVCMDVCNPDPFEIWAVDPNLVPRSAWEPMVRTGPVQWRDIFK